MPRLIGGAAVGGEGRSLGPPPPAGRPHDGAPRTAWPSPRKPGGGPAERRRCKQPGHAGTPIPALDQPRHGTIGWSAIESGRGSLPRSGAPLWGGGPTSRDCPSAPRSRPPGQHSKSPPPPPGDSREALQKVCHPVPPASARITCCATAVRRVSESSTTTTRHSAIVCQNSGRDLTLASATRNGPRWGCTSPQRGNGRGGRCDRDSIKGGEGAKPWSPQWGWGMGGVHGPPQSVRGREGRG